MRVNDIFAIENGEHIRILLCSEEQCYAVSCQHFRMPFLLSAHELKGMKSISDEEYTIFTIDDDISAAQRCERDRRFALIKPLLDNACIYDKPHRNEIVNQIVGEHGVSRRTVLQYLWKYWVYKSKNILLPTGRTSAKARELTADEKAIRWALNKYYYTPQKQSLQTAYKMMLRAKFCDAHGTLKAEYPTFWQFRYFFRQHRDPISETISRQGLKAYQRNHRPFTGSICDYAHTIGVYMTDNRQGELFPATFTMHLAQPSTAPIPDSLFALHQLLQDTIDAPFDFKDGTVYYDVIDRALLSHGWRSPTGGHTYAAKVGNALINLYGATIPAGDISVKQLHATLSRKSVAPRYILQLAVLFGLSLSELLTPPRSPAPNFKKEMQEMYRAGVSMYHIAQLYGTDAKTVARWVK